VYHLAEGKNKSQRFFDEDLEEHQPFPTLHQALDSVDPHVGFNIALKWTMQLKVCFAIFVGSRSYFCSSVKTVTISGLISVRKSLKNTKDNVVKDNYNSESINC
jgi:hypothetical protein